MRGKSEPESLNLLLAQICRLHHARAHGLLEEIGLYRGQPPVLHALWDQDGPTHSELAARLHVSPATVTKMIQRMEKAGFLVRRPDEEDQRVSRVYLTEAGRAIQSEVHEVWQTLDQEGYAEFTAEERVLLRRFFYRIRENFMRATGKDTPF